MTHYNLTILRDFSRYKDLSQNIEFVTNDSRIMAKQALLQLASPVINEAILSDPDSTVFDLRHHSGKAVNGLLEMVYHGQLTDAYDDFKDEIMQLADELEINVLVQLILPSNEGPIIKDDAPKAPEEPEKNDDPGLFKMKDGNYGCGICFKSFGRQDNAIRHYQNMHMIDKNAKTISCRYPNCDKKFAIEIYMKKHMKARHGISASFFIAKKSAPKKIMEEDAIEQ